MRVSSTIVTTPDRLSAALAGRYRIDRELGAGGMATVYLADDLKHERKVAIKVLKPELPAVLGAERFVVEIKTTAAMSHPHILPLFDSGTADGFLFYVMPYVEGETIRAKLNRETQFGVDEAVRIAREVADALDYAHRHGVIHRDIKPENILLHDGRAMVMDFGIALAVSAAAGGRMTETGLSLGTPHYMSPEQATAEKEISPKSDIYSLASVLYEMLAGQPPHIGGAAQQVIMKIITEPAEPVTKFRKSVPPNVAAAVAKALEKLPADRFESAKAFADALVNDRFIASGRAPKEARERTRAAGAWRARAAIPALALATVLAAVTTWSLTRDREPSPTARYDVALPDGLALSSTTWSPLAVSPDGSKLVYMSESGRLVLRTRADGESVELPGTESAFNPFFSHDGLRVGFMAGQAGNADIKVAVLGGGPPSTIATGVGGPGAAFGYDGFVYFDASGVGPLRRIRDSGGSPEDASVRDSLAGELQHNWPEPLPNGRGVLFVIDRSGPGVNVAATNDIAVLDLATRRHTVLMRGVYAKYARTGHIVYVTAGGALMAVPFDQDRMALTGTPVALREGITVRRGGGGVDLALSDEGTLWYGSGGNALRLEVAWVSRSGQTAPLASGLTGNFGSLALSPDGSRLAISIIDESGQQVWVKHLASADGALSKLTFRGVNQLPRWHPDGRRVLFIATFAARGNVRGVRADGTSAAPAVLVKNGERISSATWSHDGRWIAYEAQDAAGTGRDIFAVRTGGDSAANPVATTPFSEEDPLISPDGRWIMYQASTTGVMEIYVRPFPNASSGLYQVSSGGGTNAKWSRDGRELFYANGDNELVRVAVGTGPTFTFTDHRVLFPLRGISAWDVSPDGQRFIVIREREGRRRNQMAVEENFFEELRQKVRR